MKAFNSRLKIKFLLYFMASVMMLTQILDKTISRELFESQTMSYVPTRSSDSYEERIIN